MLLILLTTGYTVDNIVLDVWSRQQKSARRKLQENYADLVDNWL
jgi:hypothetical protein